MIVNFKDTSITENTRVSYPIEHINNIAIPSNGKNPKNIFFLTADAFGVLPPVSKLTKGQAMYHFISGYTAKVAGTEAGITEPQTTFSACFGAPFMPLHPTKYAEMLGEKITSHNVIAHDRTTLNQTMRYEVGISRKYSRLQRAIRRLSLLEQEIDAIWKASIPTREIVELRNMILVGRLVAEDANERTENRGLHYNKDIISIDE